MNVPGDGVERAVDELYGLSLDTFIPRRDELARELRAAGQRAEADQVKRLVKPTAPAWVVNRLARERPDEIRELLDAGAELRRVQEWLLRREADPADLRAAVEAERDAVARLVHTGADLLTAVGRAPRGDVLERIGETLHAAAADPGIRADVERGRVVQDRAAVGLGPAVASSAPAGSTRRATRSRRPAPDEPRIPKPAAPEPEARSGAADAGRKRAAAAAREELRAAEAEAKAAGRMRAAADRAVERAVRALTAAEESYERAQDGLRDAREELAEAEKAAAMARRAADAAEAEAAERRSDPGASLD